MRARDTRLPKPVPVGDDDSQGDALVRMAKVYEDRGDYAMAVSAYREAEREFGQRPDREMCAAEARRCATEINKGMHSKDEGTVTWKTLPKPVHVSKPLQSVALRPGEEKEVYRPRTDKELSSSFGKDGMKVWRCKAPKVPARIIVAPSEDDAIERYCELYPNKVLPDEVSTVSLASRVDDALPKPVPVKDFQPLGGLKCQKCGKSVSEKTRQLGGPPLCALHRAIASSSGKDVDAACSRCNGSGRNGANPCEKCNGSGWADPRRHGKQLKDAKAQDAAPRYKPTDCIYNPPS